MTALVGTTRRDGDEERSEGRARGYRVVSVRVKLIGLVLGSILPAIVGAVATERSAEQELLDEAAHQIKAVGRHFDELLDAEERHALLAVEFAAHDPHFDAALASGDAGEVQSFVDQLAAAYPHHEIIASDAAGVPVAVGNAELGVPSLDVSVSPAFADLLSGARVAGLYRIEADGDAGYGLVDASPVSFEGRQVGALALITPIDSAYLEVLSSTLDAHLVLSVDGRTLASTPEHPAPDLRTAREEVVFQESEAGFFAVETFHPEHLRTGELEAELTATRDVSALRAKVRGDLLRHLGLLGLVAIIVLIVAIRYAQRLGRAVEGMAQAARGLEGGVYLRAPVVETHDELQTLAERYNEMVAGLEERDRLKETFGRYVTRQVADHLMSQEQQLGGELVPVTVLFSDIRSFTTISESMPPRALLDFLNEYFSGMVESILTHRGVVDKFIGDAIMAVFGAPRPEFEDPLRAVRAALEMRDRLAAINDGFRARGLPEIRTGIGLHYGQVVAGNMGHSERMEYTVIGDTVNVASRLEGLTKELGVGIIISGQLYEFVKGEVEAERMKSVKVKGRAEEVVVYRVIGYREG